MAEQPIELTDAQKALIPIYQEKWFKIACATLPLTNERKEIIRNLIPKIYEAAGAKPPPEIHFMESPEAALNFLRKITKLSNPTLLEHAAYGQHEASWLSFYNYFLEVVGISECEKLRPLMELAEHAGWCWFYHEMAIVCAQPTVCSLDAEHRPHKDLGKAIEFSDRTGAYAWHGAEIPEYLVMTHKEDLDPVKVLKESNATVRMAGIQKMGFLRLKDKLPTKLISSSKNCDLLEFDIGTGSPVRGLHVRWVTKEDKHEETIIPVPSTEDKFSLFDYIPSDILNAEEDRLATLGIDPKKYDLIVET